MIRTYTREAGVRNLEREIAKLCPQGGDADRRARTPTRSSSRPRTSSDFLGVKKFRYGLAEKEDQIGVVTGLAWTQVGGDLLSIEALRLPGKGRMKTTGKLGDVMKESIDAASSLRPLDRAADRGEADEVRQDWTSTSTCPKARRPRTGRARAWRW